MNTDATPNNNVRGIKISPKDETDTNYYFLMVDLPIPSNGSAPSFGGSPGYEFEDGVLTYNCEDIENDNEEYSTYKLPIFLKNEELTSIVLNWSLNGEEQEPKSGDPADIKTSTLPTLGKANKIEAGDYQFNFEVNYVRVKFLISDSYSDIYFLILFVKTYQENSKLMNLEISDTDNSMLICNPEDNTSDGDSYITAAHMARSVKNQYTSVQVSDTGIPIPIDYPELV